jgi:hypothetical protein
MPVDWSHSPANFTSHYLTVGVARPFVLVPLSQGLQHREKMSGLPVTGVLLTPTSKPPLIVQLEHLGCRLVFHAGVFRIWKEVDEIRVPPSAMGGFHFRDWINADWRKVPQETPRGGNGCGTSAVCPEWKRSFAFRNFSATGSGKLSSSFSESHSCRSHLCSRGSSRNRRPA